MVLSITLYIGCLIIEWVFRAFMEMVVYQLEFRCHVEFQLHR